MKNPFKAFKKIFKEGYLGVDIGTSTIKAAEIIQRGNGLSLKNYGYVESYGHLDRSSGAIQTKTLDIIDEETVALLSLLKRKMQPNVKAVIASVPNFSGFVTLFDLPSMTDKEMIQAVSFQAREHIPLPIDEVLFDWSVVGTMQADDGSEKQLVLLAAIPVKIVEAYQRIFDKAGLRLDAIELDSVALVRSSAVSDPVPTVVVDIGSRATTLVVVDGGTLRMTLNSQTAGNDLTRAISRSLKVGVRRAEDLKRTRGLVSGAADQEMTTLLTPLLDGVISEVLRAMRMYEEKYGKKIERIMLSGGTANLPNVIEYFSNQLKMPVVTAAPLERLQYPDSIEPLVKELGPILSVAIGLGIKGFQA